MKPPSTSRVLLLRPAVVSEREWTAAHARARAGHPEAVFDVWDEREHPGLDAGGMLRLGRLRYSRCSIVRGAKPLGYSKARLAAAAAGAPTEFEGKVWSRWALLSSLKDPICLALYRRTLHLANRLSATRDGLCDALSGICRRPPAPPLDRCALCEDAVGRGEHVRGGGWAWRCAGCGTTWGRWAPAGRTEDGPDASMRLALRHRAERFVYLRRHEAASGAPPARILEVLPDALPADEPGAGLMTLSIGALLGTEAGPAGDSLGVFDLVLALDLLERVPRPAVLMARLREVCAPGGTLLLRVALAEGVPSPAPGEMMVVPRDALEQLCGEASFRVVRVDHLMADSRAEVWLT